MSSENQVRDALEKFKAPIGTTLDRFIKSHQDEFTYASGELSQLLRDIALAAKIINREINRAGLVGIEGAAGDTNVQGEIQQKLDVVADYRFIRALKKGGEVCGIVSEEVDEIILTGNDQGKYIVAIDPLDGSSNIDVNVSIGTIFSIYRRKSPAGTTPVMEDFMQIGRDQVAAGYVLYGSSTMLVYTTGSGTNGFTYEHSLGEFFLSHPEIQIKPDGRLYSINEGNYDEFEQSLKDYIQHCRDQRYSGRYIGSLVADFHRNMLKGGIYVYPATSASPKGKLRLLYECNALAMIVENAGGLASDGNQRILDIVPTSLHQRCPLFIGSKNMVEKALSYRV